MRQIWIGVGFSVAISLLIASGGFAQSQGTSKEAKGVRPRLSQGVLEVGREKRSAPSSQPSASSAGTAADAMKISPERGPIRIRADTLELDYKTKQVFYRGHVHATQADATLDSDTLQVIYGANFNDIKQVIAIGNVRMTRGTDVVTGQRAVLDEDKQTVVVTGDPVVQNGKDRVAGDRILVYLESQRSVVENAHAVLYPRQAQGAGDRQGGAFEKDHGTR